MKLDVRCHVRLSELLAKVWDFKRVRELKHRTEVAQRAAQKSLDEPEEFPVKVSGFDYLIVFLKNGEIREDPLADAEMFPESIPTPEIIQQARDIRSGKLDEIKEIAEGQRNPQIHWDGEQVDTRSFLTQYPPIRAKWNECFEFFDFWAEHGGMKEQIWEYVGRQTLQAADPLRPFNTVQLFRYAEQVCEESTVFSSNASFEINRLDCNGFIDRLFGELVEKYPEDLREIGLLEEANPTIKTGETDIEAQSENEKEGTQGRSNRTQLKRRKGKWDDAAEYGLEIRKKQPHETPKDILSKYKNRYPKRQQPTPSQLRDAMRRRIELYGDAESPNTK